MTLVPTFRRAYIAALVGLSSGVVAHFRAASLPTHRDIAQVWFAARALLHGGDPYQLIGPGRAFDWAHWFYPLPAALVALPLTPFSEAMAAGVFMAIGCAALTWALMEHGYAPLLLLCSSCVTYANYTAQWSPLMAGAYAIAPLGIAFVAKPTIGAAVFAARPSRWAFYGGLVLVVASFVLNPHWVAEWREALATAMTGPGEHFPKPAPITEPGGLIVLLALTRWRRPEARLLVALACVPQTLVPYEGVLLLLIPRGWVESAVFLAMSHVLVQWWAMPLEQVGFEAWVAIYGAGMVMFLYVPATLMVLRRPNEGPLPAWLERVTLRWPTWLRGREIADA